ncbi:RNA polymerase sigma factor [Pseudoteredinibacter isoporae]|uniref:RNA polymerase sigma-70 factor (ECF subfamily) n=1 Tax=Pseudoteredinibacter isoporae TaxID=570281 RepID=A0A7X0MU02_9GAMM|nr:sigma-70 family RNA polymerase sigma factor [Pseudoteredinibacter isoporae]MBB6519738.1 RNA polymerase sigma-70 factor (ECF subfamily) [Pseudoteredinibacter isoporae]NHO85319.1 sigma-70 family RNA polymerase sigma factor [Pseudoteredinibacter isoporae]NIB26229.1 sigma-70 family RNA polymerase sigma factor [Pseudoteredinibacter isoporae]
MTNLDSTADIQWVTLLKNESPRILAALARQCGDIELAEDALQEALGQAWQQWPEQGLPDKPGAWLLHVARCRLLDHWRQQGRIQDGNQSLLESSENESSQAEEAESDQRLALIFCCCHPAIDETSQLALLLQLLGGLNYREIASQLMLSDAVVQRRLSRAKLKIKQAKIPMEVPGRDLLFSRQGHIRSMIYLMFNHGIELQASQRESLLQQAIELLMLLRKEVDSPEAMGLQALIMAVLARRIGEGDDQDIKRLSEQNRRLWDKKAIRQADILLQKALALKELGPMQIQAAIQMLHSQAESWEETDWPQIIYLYELLIRQQASPVPKLNQTMARFYSGEPAEKIWEALCDLEVALEQHSGFYAARMQILIAQNKMADAEQEFQRALSCESAPRQRRLLERQWARAQIK